MARSVLLMSLHSHSDFPPSERPRDLSAHLFGCPGWGTRVRVDTLILIPWEADCGYGICHFFVNPTVPIRVLSLSPALSQSWLSE